MRYSHISKGFRVRGWGRGGVIQGGLGFVPTTLGDWQFILSLFLLRLSFLLSRVLILIMGAELGLVEKMRLLASRTAFRPVFEGMVS